MDLFGPFVVKRARTTAKRYCCLFTCNTVRAVHLEVVYNLSSDSFMQAYRRFAARRGPAVVLRSDRGTNFVGAEREMNNAIAEWNEADLKQKFQQVGVQWKFNVSGASHHGGVHERMIRSARSCLRHVVELQVLDDEALLTLVTEVEGILNGRPLQPFSNDPNSLKALSPNDLLIPKPMTGLPLGVVPDEGLLKRKWRQVQQLANVFWKRFASEYLQTLSMRSKWHTQRRDIRIGDLVIMVEPNQPRSQWPLARVTQVRRSEDGRVRSCTLKTAKSEYERPITKVVLLEGVDLNKDM